MRVTIARWKSGAESWQRRGVRIPGVAILVVALGSGLSLWGAGPDYLHEVKPLLAKQCVLCHGATTSKSGLRLDTAAHAVKGGVNGAAVIPGQPDASPLLQAIEGRHSVVARMPYKRPPLDSEQVAVLRRWIAGGAPAPDGETPSSDRHWAFVAPRRSPVPEAGSGRSNPIDAFIDARLEKEGLQPSPEAEAAVLARRLWLDLTGLPPTSLELSGFLTASDGMRVERAVDRLMASPRYGERWARWWLDVARYADSNGYSIDGIRPIWPYRDWVVRAFNADLGFDTFTRWQIAGDLYAAEGTDAVVASGFHRNTQVNHEGGIDPEQYRIESAMDRVSTTGTAWLGLSMGCAQCHDHKFDPFTQRDYYGLYAYFNSTENDGHGASDYAATGPVLELPTDREIRELGEWELELKRLERAAAGNGGTPDEASKKALSAWKRKRPVFMRTMVMRELAQPRETVVFVKGDFTRPGERVTPAWPAVFGGTAAGGKGDRRELAAWLVSRDNPLTARVVVNRLWQAYFGRGLVETENDFGTMGSEPTHPELLDWLACELMDSGWSLKRIHRLIVTSAVYQRSSQHRSDLAERDARNRWWARQTRLRMEAEMIRDAALVASGLMDGTLGGAPVFPPQPEGLGAFTQSRREWVVSRRGDRFRRSLYTHLQRSTLHPGLAVFDAPDTFTTCTRRQRSNTPLQALTLLNDPAFDEIAAGLARRMAALTGDDGVRLGEGFRWVTGRSPDSGEGLVLRRLLDSERVVRAPDPWRAVARVLLNLDESQTRE